MSTAIEQEIDVPEQDFVINIRDDATSLFETGSGELYADTEEGTYKLSLTGGGVVPEEASKSEVEGARVLEPADRETEEIDDGDLSPVSVRTMD